MHNPHPQRAGYAQHGAVAIDPSGAQVRPRFRGASVGQARHRLIQEMVSAGHRNPSSELIKDFVFGHEYVTSCRDLTSTLIARRLLAVPTAIYFARHQPGRDWDVLGVEVPCGASAFDIVWQLPDDRVLVDELKTEEMTLAARLAVADQVSRFISYGAELWPGRFAGVRLCVLFEPWRSMLYRPDGTCESLGAWP
jgi:hypothetical protein